MKLAANISPSANIDRRAVVASDVSIGPACVIYSGAVLCSGVTLSSDVTVGPNAVFVESEETLESQNATVQHGVRIGANATIYPGVTLAAGCVVRPGSVVNRSVPSRAIVEGNPAMIIGYVGVESEAPNAKQVGQKLGRGAQKLQIRGVTVHTFPMIPDLRGNLTVGEFSKEIPFTPLRYFMVFGVPSREVHGEHAHRTCHQFLICVTGSCAVIVDDGHQQIEVLLEGPNRGIYLPPMTWGIQYKYSSDALLLVFASHHYDAEDYIRNYDEFQALAKLGAL